MRNLGSIEASGSGNVAALPTLAEIRHWTQRLQEPGHGLDDPERIDMLRALEELRCAVEGAQAEVTADFVLSQREAAARRDVPAARGATEE